MKAEAVIAKLFAMFPNGNASKQTVLGYIERLSCIPVDELEIIINQCIDESEFLPTVAKIKEMHRRLTSNVSPDMAAEGWLSVQKAMHDPATYSPDPEGPPPKFRDPLVQRAVAALGWHTLRMSENAMADRAQFLKLYEAFARNIASEEKLSPQFKQLREQHSDHQVESLTNGLVKRLSG
jgi:hypothetical protein